MRCCLRRLAALAACAWGASASLLRAAGVHSHNGASDSVTKNGRSGFVANKVRYDLNLANLKASRRAADGKKNFGTFLVNGSVQGQEFACLSCNPQLFRAWLQQLSEPARSAKAPKPAKKAEAEVVQNDKEGKHPGSPGYEEWARQQKSLGLLRRAASKSIPMNESINLETKSEDNHTAAVTVTDLDDTQIEAMKQRLQTLWKDRRLVIGQTENPMDESMDFVEALVSLARESPALTATECGDQGLPHCNSLFSGKKTASGSELQDALEKTFGKEFLQLHKQDPSKSPEEERKSVKALLKALKSNFTFYYQKCLNHEPGAESCNAKAESELVGQLACKPIDDEPSDDCVYAELRLCQDCAEQRKPGRFFEYSRFHGPLALFETRQSRNRVMGQCEEFSRAGHALLAALGYEARYVLDFTDHVWIEVKLPSGNTGKWVHADPSEGILDEPLMYEKGWGKKLTMIFAFTPTYIKHVTPTYTADYEKTVWRRGVSDASLKEVLSEANQRLGFELPRTKWGHHSVDRDLGNIALWSHFEGASNKI